MFNEILAKIKSDYWDKNIVEKWSCSLDGRAQADAPAGPRFESGQGHHGRRPTLFLGETRWRFRKGVDGLFCRCKYKLILLFAALVYAYLQQRFEERAADRIRPPMGDGRRLISWYTTGFT